MYSIVMMAAMSAGADVTPTAPPPTPVTVAPAPAISVGCCGGAYLAGCTGCTGCYGSGYGYGCCGGYSSCYGCCGGGCHGRGGFLGIFHHKRGGCCGGYTCFGCCGGCSGWWSGACFGSCYGSCYGCSGSVMYGSTWGPPVGMPPYTLHGYNSGAAPVWTTSTPVYPGSYASPAAVYGQVYYPNQPPVMSVPVAPAPKPSSDNPPPSGANLKFDIPADAKLFVDGKPVADGGLARTFYTPALEPGRDYYYEVHTERTVDGKQVATEKKKVIVKSGKSITVNFDELTAAKSVVKK
jgi:uncharacterized protein (TIGR03000 family)